MRRIFTLICTAFIFQAYAQDLLEAEIANTITAQDLEEHLTILASDALEGRETGKRGQKMAAEYIKYFFQENDLDPPVSTGKSKSYMQKFKLVKPQPGKISISVDDNTYSNQIDFVYFGEMETTNPLTIDLVFIGEGKKDDFLNVDLVGKSVLMYNVEGDTPVNVKARRAEQAGAGIIFIVEDKTSFDQALETRMREVKNERLSFPKSDAERDKGYFIISEAVGADIVGMETSKMLKSIKKGKNYREVETNNITLFASRDDIIVETENVLGYIEGNELKDELLVITAHYDHIGVINGKVNNGADDDGSGTVAVLEMAQAFSEATKRGHGPKRSILFMTVTGEEKGLFGSEYYTENPVFPLSNTVTNLNIDMIGRVDPKHELEPNYVYLIGSDRLSQELHDISESTNASCCQLNIDYTFNEKSDPNRFYYRSDHYNFAKKGIPIIFYFNGTHADYHQPTDTVDKINFDLLEKRTKLIFHTAWELANREERPALNSTP